MVDVPDEMFGDDCDSGCSDHGMFFRRLLDNVIVYKCIIGHHNAYTGKNMVEPLNKGHFGTSHVVLY